MLQHLLRGNGILCLYNMFPYQYSNLAQMTQDLPRIASMGFNAVWVNPIQKTGEGAVNMSDRKTGVFCDTPVNGSLYGVQHYDFLDPRFLFGAESYPTDWSAEQLAEESKRRIRAFTKKAKDFGMVPLFDLVLNHIASDSPLCKEHEKDGWFLPVNSTYPDVRPFNYKDPVIRRQIIDKLWRPYLEQYIIKYGFTGVRVDLAWDIDQDLRREIYAIIHELVEKYHHQAAIIFDEALYKGPSHDEVRSRMQTPPPEPGATHITQAGGYYGRPHPTGELEHWVKAEMPFKNTVISHHQSGVVRETYLGGGVNFTGNHDELSLGGTVIEDMALQRLRGDVYLARLYDETARRFDGEDGKKHAYCRQILYKYAHDIRNEIQAGDSTTCAEFERRCCEKIGIAAFTAKAGWYALCGDEYGDDTAKSVFRHAETQQDFYPHRQHKIFTSVEAASALEKVLDAMAVVRIRKDAYMRDLFDRDHMHQAHLLEPYKETIRMQINAGVSAVCEEFATAMQQAGHSVTFDAASDYIAHPRQPANHWQASSDFMAFITQTNAILQRLHPAHGEFSCEVFKSGSIPSVWAFVRNSKKEGMEETDAEVDTEVVFINTCPNMAVELTPALEQEIHSYYAARTGTQLNKPKLFVGEGITIASSLQQDARVCKPVTLPMLPCNISSFFAQHQQIRERQAMRVDDRVAAQLRC